MGSTFAARCLSCFSGTVLSVLLLYAGASGSPLTGALLLLSLSLCLGALLLLPALLTSSILPFVSSVKRLRPVLGLVSALVMVSFGVAMILGKEHLLSDYVYRLLGLG